MLAVSFMAAMIWTVRVANANFTPRPDMPSTPDLNEPLINLKLPKQNMTYNTTVPYSIVVEKPSSWFQQNNYVHGNIMEVEYIIDEVQHVLIGDETDPHKQEPFTYAGTISGLSEGNHTIRVHVNCQSYYATPDMYIYDAALIYFLDSYSDNVSFAVDVTAPSISFLISGQNATYPLGEVPLGFVVNEPASKLTYCLDEGENVTIAGNCTLTNLPNGLHNLTVYVRDSAGNVGASERITFTVDTHESAAQPKPFPWLPIAAVSVVVAAVVTVVALVYLKKRKHPNAGVVKNP